MHLAQPDDLIARARAWRAAQQGSSRPARLVDPWTDTLSSRLAALLGPYREAELPLSTQRQVLQVLVVAWNLSRCTPDQRPSLLSALELDPLVQPMLHRFARVCERRWPADRRFILSAELSAAEEGIEVRCASLG